MEIPSGMEVGSSKILVLKKRFFGLVQSARHFYVKLCQSTEELRIHGWFGESLSMGQEIQYRNSYDGNLCGQLPKY
jgi:hypothetical protein